MLLIIFTKSPILKAFRIVLAHGKRHTSPLNKQECIGQKTSVFLTQSQALYAHLSAKYFIVIRQHGIFPSRLLFPSSISFDCLLVRRLV